MSGIPDEDYLPWLVGDKIIYLPAAEVRRLEAEARRVSLKAA